MAGHSKWANIKHRKGRQDAARGKLFAKLARAIEQAAREGGGDPAMNIALANAIAKAKAASMPNDNIDRAVKRGSGEGADSVAYEETWYEGYGPGGVAVYVHVLTDNRNRAASDVRATMTRNNGNLGEPGSVSYLFSQRGLIVARGDEETILLTALDAGADDVRETGDSFEVESSPSALNEVRSALEGVGVDVESAEVTQLPSTTVAVDADGAGKILRLIDALEDLDDVQEVFANFDVSDEIMEQLAG
ncbi:MAG TPA: YebC/PmpR family DNA-binding transcriptional regulator [Acidimicrobiia bacterium]|nr:YebC/PmpR family DNA-binding transcriptional regulator [Acidimicrobiia bacterium]